MPGFNPLFPRRIVVDEIITTGNTQATGVTGWTVQGASCLRYNSWATPLPPSSSARVLAVTNASTSASTTLTTFTAQPDYPRAVRVCPSTSAFVSAGSSVSVAVTGTNQFGTSVTDTISVGNGPGPIDGIIAFKTITSIVLPACSSPLTPFTIGLSNIFGLDRTPLSTAAVIRGSVNGAPEGTAAIIGVASTSGTVSPATALAVPSRATAKISTSATTSAGALVELMFVAQDVAHI